MSIGAINSSSVNKQQPKSIDEDPQAKQDLASIKQTPQDSTNQASAFTSL